MATPTPPLSAAACADLDPGFLEHLLDTITEAIPASENETPQAGATRRYAARLALLALRPADAFQAMLAAQAIAAHYAVMDAFRRAAQADLPPAMATRLRANAATLARMMQATVRTLRQHQAPPPDQAVPRTAPKSPAVPSRPVAKPEPARAVDQVPAESAPEPQAPRIGGSRQDMTMEEWRETYGQDLMTAPVVPGPNPGACATARR